MHFSASLYQLSFEVLVVLIILNKTMHNDDIPIKTNRIVFITDYAHMINENTPQL